MNAVQKLRQIVDELRRGAGDAASAWALAGRLLERMPGDSREAARACAAKDLDALDAIVAALENPGAARAPAAATGAAAPAADVPDETMRAALRAFHKRLKLARLADESKLGGRQLTGGKRSEIDAIIPPTEYPREVWEALVRAGKLRRAGSGFYADA